MKTHLILILCAAVLAAALSCRDDDTVTPRPKNVQDEDLVLINLELAYNERNFEEFEKLLDEDFVFVFSDVDFNEGKVDFQQWDRDSELASNQKILDPNLPADNRVVSIDLKLDYPPGNWTELPPDENHPTESWYTKTVNYNLVIKTADQWEHRATGEQAQFTIRWGETEGGEHWQIVLWRDDVGSSLALSPGGKTVASSTWGTIKAMYS
jgi:hypothetical protein